jgi:hypothetical protein
MLPQYITQILTCFLTFLLPCFLCFKSFSIGNLSNFNPWLFYFFSLGLLLWLVFPLFDAIFMRPFYFIYPEIKLIFLILLLLYRIKWLHLIQATFDKKAPVFQQHFQYMYESVQQNVQAYLYIPS